MTEKATNPFAQVYDALWTLVVNHPGIAEKVRVGNRISFGNDDRNPFKEKVSASDTPELVLTQDGGPISMMNTSSTTMVVMDYSWLISTGDFRLNHYLNDVEWMLFIAHLGWKSILTSLTYGDNDWHFVKKCDIVSRRSGVSDKERNRGIKGWSAVWGVRIEMHFKTSDLKQELQA